MNVIRTVRRPWSSRPASACPPGATDGPRTYDEQRPPTDSLVDGNVGIQAKDVGAATDRMATDLLARPALNASPHQWTVVLTAVENKSTDPTMSYDVFDERLKARLAQMGQGRVALIENKGKYHDLQNQELENPSDPYGQGPGGPGAAGVQPDYALYDHRRPAAQPGHRLLHHHRPADEPQDPADRLGQPDLRVSERPMTVASHCRRAAALLLLGGCASAVATGQNTALDSTDLVRMTDDMATAIEASPAVRSAVAAEGTLAVVVEPVVNQMTAEVLPAGPADAFTARVRTLLARHDAGRYTWVMNKAAFYRLRGQELDGVDAGPAPDAISPRYALTATFTSLAHENAAGRSDYYVCNYALTNLADRTVLWTTVVRGPEAGRQRVLGLSPKSETRNPNEARRTKSEWDGRRSGTGSTVLGSPGGR